MISNEEKKIILRQKPLPKYYISLKHIFPSIYEFIKRDLFKRVKENEDISEDIIYDYKLDNIWLTKDYFEKYQDVFIGYISNSTFDKYYQVIQAQSDLARLLYERYLRIRHLSFKELNKKIKQYKGSTEKELAVFYEYCYYDRISRLLPVKLVNRLIYIIKYIPRYKYQSIGRQKILNE